MKEFRVMWEIDVEAEDAQEAAEKALEIQRNRESIATYFTVFETNDGKTNYDTGVDIDVGVPDGEEVN